MFLIDKIKFKFKNLLQFEKLNPIDDFEFTESIAYRASDENIMLFEKAIKKHLNLKEVIWIAIYHCLNSFNFENECLTVLSTDLNLIVDLFEGNDSNVVVPQSVKSEYQKGNVLATFHNHYSGSILPSINNFNNSILPKLNFTVITSRNIFGIIVNDNDSLSPDNFQLLINDFKLFEIYLTFVSQLKKLTILNV